MQRWSKPVAGSNLLKMLAKGHLAVINFQRKGV
jgi:hypothetical protein